MNILIIFGVIVGIIVMVKIFRWFAELAQYTRLASAFSSDVNKLALTLKLIRVPDMRKELNIIRNTTQASMGRMAAPDGKIINICPRCGGAMQVKSVYRGFYVSCTKEGCGVFENIEATDANLMKFKIL